MDYDAVVRAVLEFARCDERKCINVFISNDLIPEPIESFFVTLERTPDLSDVITLDPTEAEIEIIDANSMFGWRYRMFISETSSTCSGCGGSGEDRVYSLRGCGCGRDLCHCV